MIGYNNQGIPIPFIFVYDHNNNITSMTPCSI